MRRYYVTFLLAFVLASLGAYVYFVELPAERRQVETETAEKEILPFGQQEITGLRIRSASGEVVLAQGENRAWKISAPLQTDADSREVEALLRALTLGKVSRVIEEKPTALAPYGLETPSVVLTVSAGPRQEVLSLGDSGPITSTLYAMRSSDPKVLLTDLAPKDFLNKTLLSFRKKEVLQFEQSRAERLRLTYPQHEIVLYKMDNKWKIRAPIEAPADQVSIRTLLLKLEDLKALGFVDPGPQHAALTARLKNPAVKITLHLGEGEQTVKLFQPDPASGEAYAVTAAQGPIYQVNPATIKDFTKALFDLQDRRLLGMEKDEIATLAVKTRQEQYVLVHQPQGQGPGQGAWVLEDQPEQRLDSQTVDLFVSRVTDLPAEQLVVKRAGPLAPYGLGSPAAEFTATDKGGKARGRLILGARSGGLVYAMGQGLPGIYQARPDILTQIPSKRDLLAKKADAGPVGF